MMCDIMNSMYDSEDILLFGGNLIENTLPGVDLEQDFFKQVENPTGLNGTAPCGGELDSANFDLPSPNSDWMSNKMDLGFLANCNTDFFDLLEVDNKAVCYNTPTSPCSSLDSGVSSPGGSSTSSEGFLTCDSPPTDFSSLDDFSFIIPTECVTSQDDNASDLLSELGITIIPDEAFGTSVESPTTDNLVQSHLDLQLNFAENQFLVAEVQPAKSKAGRKSKISSTVERKQRKRDQNKNAATRYRERKRQELQERCNEESTLQERNRSLSDKVSQISREIDYLKDLMIEVYRIKGLIT